MVSPVEYEAAYGALQAKALRFRFAQAVRVQAVGMRLLQALPAEVRTAPVPYTGLMLIPLDRRMAQLFEIPRGVGRWEYRGTVVAGVVPGGPADQAGIQSGDLLVQIGGVPVRTVEETVQVFRRLTIGSTTQLLIERRGAPQWIQLTVGEKPYPVSFQVLSDGEGSEVWNAWASPGQVTVTARLLEFMRSDDELAVVMGHELAHLTQHHVAKGLGTSLLGSVLASAISTVTGVDVLGDVSGGVVQSAFSRDFEREADYLGLQYAHRAGFDIAVAPGLWERVATQLPRRVSIPWLSTHPSDPERLVRLQKAVEEITSPASGAAPAPHPPDPG